ncbi:hypothetical protein ACU686_27375 [Yinghuangia aomiensis]
MSGRGGQVDVSLRDVMLSQLNYRAAAYLNEGTEPRRMPQRRALLLRSRAVVPDRGRPPGGGVHHTHDGFWKSLRRRGGHRGLPRRWPNAPPTATTSSPPSPGPWRPTPPGPRETRLRPTRRARGRRCAPSRRRSREAPEAVVDRRARFRLVASPIRI